MACLHFTCPNTNRIAPTGVEMDVQGLRTHWRSTLTLNCPHCDDVHDVCVSEVYLAACIASLDPYGSLPGRRYPPAATFFGVSLRMRISTKSPGHSEMKSPGVPT